MFVFLAVHFDQHPDYNPLLRRGEDATRVLSDQLWLQLADSLVLFAPGWGFDANGPHKHWRPRRRGVLQAFIFDSDVRTDQDSDHNF